LLEGGPIRYQPRPFVARQSEAEAVMKEVRPDPDPGTLSPQPPSFFFFMTLEPRVE